ncbi:ORF6N domain-containing protein [Acinetobacter sp. BIGb0102]|uniref:ORF6N domain-containing protein n=1 Tax=Acinetobacter sp. BIGb0102 TaxID=2485131 RepID=UPI000F4F5500|nr:ORF6N domain-containing protein [Acinetobacter sp. BIGb0102]RPE30860.1 ORF6N domain-containing protein [Acinetobacter sp. BIGb0102]
MASLAQINDTQVSIINFKSVPVLTTEQLSKFYDTEPVRIRQNHHENKGRFVEGKHFFKITGQELKDFVSSLKLLTNFPVISNKTRSLILWTERGAARHAKMLDTDQAWEVFEQLEDCYFVRKEILAKTHKSEREPLTNAVNMLVAKTKHLNYSDAYKLVHQRFNVEHIEDIPFDSIPVAVEYVHHLIALYSNAPNHFPSQPPDLDSRAKNVAIHMYWVSAWWRCFGDSIRMLNPKMAGHIHDNFADGAFSAGLILGCDYSQELNAHILKELPYDLSESGRIDHFRRLQF